MVCMALRPLQKKTGIEYERGNRGTGTPVKPLPALRKKFKKRFRLEAIVYEKSCFG